MPKRASKNAAKTIGSTKKVVKTTVRPPDQADEFPVYFLSLTVRNIRCFGDTPQTLRLCTDAGHWAPWTIILGNNGVGKSTLLQSLAEVQWAVEYFEETISKATFGESVDFLGKVLPRNDIRESWRLAGRPASNYSPGESCEVAVELAFGESGRRFTDENVLRLTVNGLLGIDSPVSICGGENRSPVVIGYGPWRDTRISQLATNAGLKWLSNPHLFSPDSPLTNAEEWLLRADYAAEKDSSIQDTLRRRLQQVKDLLLKLLPEDEVSDIRITTPTDRTPDPEVRFATPYGEVTLRQLGCGFQSLIAWIVDFAAQMFEAYPDSEDALGEPAICLIDEIDLHLHPTWQRKVMRYLSDRFPKTQFIATAHSPLIVQSAPEIGANVAVLRREGDHVVILNNPVDVMGWRADQILSSELFDEVPLRSDTVQAVVNERTRLLSKPKLAAAEKVRLKELDAQVNTLPVGSTAKDRAVAQQLKAAVELLDHVTAKK